MVEVAYIHGCVGILITKIIEGDKYIWEIILFCDLREIHNY